MTWELITLTFPETRQWATLPVKVSKQFPFHIFPISIHGSYPKHRHDFLELSLVLDGEGYEIINGKEHPMKAGTCALFLPYHFHEIHTTSRRPLKLFNLMFDLGFLLQPSIFTKGLKNLMYASDNLSPFIQLDDKQFLFFHAIMESLYAELQNDHEWRNDMIQCKLTELLITFDRLRRDGNDSQTWEQTDGRKSLWPIVHYIHTNFSEPISLSRLSKQFNIDISHLSKEFKKHMGMNFTHFLQEVRVRHAGSLLVSTNMSGIEIAMEAGFGSISSYSRIFTQVIGMTPSDYRNQYASD
ncbi:AraC family transcriptional regulator [Paenibacillus sp. J5C_2022]|uniref:AraC family transcriptional regulator n=1 Tax=Paenibacillus sp. J5C2022 TaxID=2977129 RepID=UPI0021CE05CF|nr:AraC family transcriptional regulator [Paenibacillus sp. J5C2022]MCU6710827.1 AraC family transcriptional regulator [Paenibacillus sp. J5C2022]